jgi:hypothetical protein
MKELQRLKNLKPDVIVIIDNECHEELNKVSLQVNTFSATLKCDKIMKGYIESRYRIINQTSDFTQIECNPFDLYCFIKTQVKDGRLTPNDVTRRFEILKSKFDYSTLKNIEGLTWEMEYIIGVGGFNLHIESGLTPEMVMNTMRAFYNKYNYELIRFYGFDTKYLSVAITQMNKTTNEIIKITKVL